MLQVAYKGQNKNISTNVLRNSLKLLFDYNKYYNCKKTQLRKGAKGACAPGGTVHARHLEGWKYGIIKFGRFWRIGICIGDSDILHPLKLPQFLDHTP